MSVNKGVVDFVSQSCGRYPSVPLIRYKVIQVDLATEQIKSHLLISSE